MKKVVARLFVKREEAQAFKKQAAVIIQNTRKEIGCLFYSLFEDVGNPGEFLFYEEYADQDALAVHSKSEYLKNFRASVKDMLSRESIVDITG